MSSTRFDPATQACVDAVIEALAGPDAKARDDQREAVAALVDARRRVLVVQATGWGKSAVYWAATAARRAAGAGPTLVISPLLALMRDQVDAAHRAGLVAATINSTNIEDWDEVLARLHRDELDVLLISPERLANPAFAARLGPLAARCGLLVIDEAHCISDWGFDFRPDYQRLSGVLMGMATDTPVLATTATANARVTADVADQLGPDTVVLRGPLARTSLRLAVLDRLNPLERYAWTADACEQLPGSGIVYVLTVAETERLAGWLRSEGLDAVAYNSRLEPAERRLVEDRLRANTVKVVVATSALGMGYDKPDLAFVVHLGSPASPVAYYQQVGRAGRALDDALAVLIPSSADEPLWEYFATASIPDPQAAAEVLRRLGDDGPATIPALEKATGLRRGRLETLLKVLAVDGAVEGTRNGWASTGHAWYFDTKKYAALRAVRAAEADLMRRYAAGEGCLMGFLQEALGDATSGPCGRCSVCTGELPAPGARPALARVEAVRAYLRGQDVQLEPRKMWPPGLAGRKGRIAGAPEVGRALAYADDPAWADALGRLGPSDGPLSDDVVAGVTAMVDRWSAMLDRGPVAVVVLRSASHPIRVASLAAAVAARLDVAVLDAVALSGPAAPDHAASLARVTGLLATMQVGHLPRQGPLVVVADTYRTGWTMTVAATLLAEAGATAVYPLALHQLP